MTKSKVMPELREKGMSICDFVICDDIRCSNCILEGHTSTRCDSVSSAKVAMDEIISEIPRIRGKDLIGKLCAVSNISEKHAIENADNLIGLYMVTNYDCLEYFVNLESNLNTSYKFACLVNKEAYV